MFIIEKKVCEYTLLCHFSLPEHKISMTKDRQITKLFHLFFRIIPTVGNIFSVLSVTNAGLF